MTILTHALTTVLGIKILNLQGPQIGQAIVFGMLIDLDHLPGHLSLAMNNGFKVSKKLVCYRMHTVIHEPIFAFPIAIISWMTGSMVPILFWGIHMLMDHLLLSSEKRPFYPFRQNWISYGLLPLNSKWEWLFDILLIWMVIFQTRIP